MYHFYSIESPLQLLSAISAAKKFSDKPSILLVYLGGSRRAENNRQIMDLIDHDFWKNVIFKKKEKGIRGKVRKLKFLFQLKKDYAGKIDKYFLGEYRRFEMSAISGLVKAKECILLDDGSYTITAQNHFILNGKQPYAKNISSKIFSSLVKGCVIPNLYSFYDLKLCDGQVNYFSLPEKKSVPINENEVYFFGSKFTEMNNMEPGVEVEILRKVIQEYPGKTVFYIPHRDETPDKLSSIGALGYIIKSLGVPAEIFFDSAEVMPKVVVSYFSTTLYTCFIRFNNVEIATVDVRHFLLKKNSINSAGYIYDYYQNLGFHFVRT